MEPIAMTAHVLVSTVNGLKIAKWLCKFCGFDTSCLVSHSFLIYDVHDTAHVFDAIDQLLPSD